jgi:hypothetical protein
MGFSRWWMDRVPGLRYWFSGSALLGLLLTVYNVLVGIIGIAPITESSLKWSLLLIGLGLALCIWYSLARDQQREETKDAALHQRLDSLPSQVVEVTTDFKTRLDRAMQDLAEAQGDTEAERKAREHITKLFSDTITSLDRYVQNDVIASDLVRGLLQTLGNGTLPADERVSQAEIEVRNYMRKRVSGLIVFLGEAELLRTQLDQTTEAISPPKPNA